MKNKLWTLFSSITSSRATSKTPRQLPWRMSKGSRMLGSAQAAFVQVTTNLIEHRRAPRGSTELHGHRQRSCCNMQQPSLGCPAGSHPAQHPAPMTATLCPCGFHLSPGACQPCPLWLPAHVSPAQLGHTGTGEVSWLNADPPGCMEGLGAHFLSTWQQPHSHSHGMSTSGLTGPHWGNEPCCSIPPPGWSPNGPDAPRGAPRGANVMLWDQQRTQGWAETQLREVTEDALPLHTILETAS